eukprot:GHVQ01020608.1.p1 GENE.GHVQ01020608.1~~GHVQ01020608.1.p1  ORF type:complete len:754 (-),score=104.99 GHVQ01020608.1:1699-3960(-)
MSEKAIYSCPEDTELVGDSCVTKEYYEPEILCPGSSQYDRSGKTCHVTEYRSPSAKCPAGYEKAKDNKCVKYQPLKPTASCPDGFGLSVSVSSTPLPIPPSIVNHRGPPVTVHPHSAVIHHQTTVGSAHGVPSHTIVTEHHRASYSPPHRVLQDTKTPVAVGSTESDQKCIRRTNSPPELGCPPPFTRQGNRCVEKEKSDATGKCPPGFDLLDGRDCARLIPAAPLAQCEDGFALDGEQCVKRSFVKASPSCKQGTFDGKTCRYESIDVVQMRCPELYTFDPQIRKCIRVIEREPIPTCPEGYKMQKASTISGDGRKHRSASEPHAKTGVLHVDNVCYLLEIFDAAWLCPPNGSLTVPHPSTSQQENNHNPHDKNLKGKEMHGSMEPTCGLVHSLPPLMLCPPGSEASPNGECIVKQKVPMRFECPQGFRIDPRRRQCFKSNSVPLQQRCRVGELQYGNCVEVEIAPMKLQCPAAAKPAADACMVASYSDQQMICSAGEALELAVASAGKEDAKQSSASPSLMCKKSFAVPAKLGCRAGDKSVAEHTDDIPSKKKKVRSHSGRSQNTARHNRNHHGHPTGHSHNNAHNRSSHNRPVRNQCVSKRMNRPNVRCPTGYDMGFDGMCVSYTESEAQFECDDGYYLMPAGRGKFVCMGSNGGGDNDTLPPTTGSNSGMGGHGGNGGGNQGIDGGIDGGVDDPFGGLGGEDDDMPPEWLSNFDPVMFPSQTSPRGHRSTRTSATRHGTGRSFGRAGWV